MSTFKMQQVCNANKPASVSNSSTHLKHHFTSSSTSETSPVEPRVQFDFSKLPISDPTSQSTIPSKGLSSTPIIRRKLRLEPMNDQYEQKAVKVAPQILKGLEASTQSIYKRQSVEEHQRKPFIQCSIASNAVSMIADAEDGIWQVQGGGTSVSDPVRRLSDTVAHPLANSVRQKMEQAFGQDFSSVRIYEGSQAPSIGALAYTQGRDIHFAPGAYQPENPSGQRLIGHELAHVVQQSREAVRPEIRIKGLSVNTDEALEKEADVWGKTLAYGTGQQTRTINADVGESRAMGISNAIQCKFGFELELGVLLSQKYGKVDDESAYADPGLGKQEYIGDPTQTLIALTEDHASGGPRSQGGSQFEKHAILTQEEREKGYRSRIGVVPPGSEEGKEKQSSSFESEAEVKERETTELGYEVRKGQGYTSILEIVTQAVDETVSVEEATAPMKAAYDLTKLIDRETEGLTKKVPLTRVVPRSNRSDLYLGYNDANKNGQTLSANIQVSYGLKLAAVPEMIAQHAKMTSSEDKAVIETAQKNLDKLWKTLELLSKKSKTLKTPLPKDDAKIKGLMSLITLYLVSGSSATRAQGLDKNIVPLLVRHPIGTSAKSLSQDEKDFLLQEPVIKSLLNVNNRKEDELLFKERDFKSFPGPISQGGPQPKCGEWVISVISGHEQGDIFHFFEETRRIEPSTGNPKVSLDVVLEARTIRSNQLSKEEAKEVEVGRFPPDQWVGLAKDYWDKLRKLHGLHE